MRFLARASGGGGVGVPGPSGRGVARMENGRGWGMRHQGARRTTAQHRGTDEFGSEGVPNAGTNRRVVTTSPATSATL